MKSDATVSTVLFAAAAQCDSEWHRVLFFLRVELLLLFLFCFFFLKKKQRQDCELKGKRKSAVLGNPSLPKAAILV